MSDLNDQHLLNYNIENYVLELLKILQMFIFTTSKVAKHSTRLASRASERLDTWDQETRKYKTKVKIWCI